jgi:putative FmdB family regulatory protein
MPIYEYQCMNCGHSFEKLVRLSDPQEPVCPHCNSGDTQKKMSAANTRSSGSGGSGEVAAPARSRFT